MTDVAAVQAICDSFGPEQIDALLRKWLAGLPHPFTAARPGRRLPLRALDPAGRVLPDPGARPAGLRADLLRAGHPRQPRHRPPRPGQPDLRPRSSQRPQRTPGRFRTRVITDGRHPVAARRLQEHQDQAVPQGREGAAHRDHDQRHPRLRHRQTADQPARTAADRLLRQPTSARRPTTQPRPDPRRRRVHRPHRPDHHRHRHPLPGLRFGDARAHALLQALLVFRLLPRGFTNRDLRTLSRPCSAATRGHHRRADDLRPAPATRPRAHRPHPAHPPLPGHRHRAAARAAVHPRPHHLLRTGLAEITDPDPPAPSRLRAADRAYQPPSTNSPDTPTSPPDHNRRTQIDSIMPASPAQAS